MAKKQSAKRAFDWTTYTRPERRLTEAQEESLNSGILSAVLEFARERESVVLEIRARQLALYHRGANLLRISGDGPFSAELDVSYRRPRQERTGEVLERRELATAADVAACLDDVRAIAEELERSFDPALDLTDRGRKQAIAQANAGQDPWNDEYVIVDLEYQYGKRRYDLIALRRTPGITGPGGFANPRLAFVHVQGPTQPLAGASGPASVAADLAEFVKAVGGEHLRRARVEIEELYAQKARLGLLPDLDFRGLTDEMPEMLVIFTGADVAAPTVDAAVIEVHDRLLARHFPVERLRFAHLPQAAMGGSPEELRLGADGVMTYREFKEYRRR